MCISAAAAWLAANVGTIGAVSGAVGAATSLYSATQAGKGGVDPAKAQAEADAQATRTANSRLAQRRRALSSQSLATGAGEATGISSGVLSGGKSMLGG